MKRTTLACVFCALAGALVGAAMTTGMLDPFTTGTPAFAQTPLAQTPIAQNAIASSRTAPAARASADKGRSAYDLPSPTNTAPVRLTPEELANIRVYEVANQGVVNITTSSVQVDPFFGMRQLGQGSGSGSIIDRQGHILTNNHVIEDAQNIQVTLSNGETYKAELIGADVEYDIAVLKINAPADRLVPIEMGRSDELRVGQKAYAVGNPFGLEGTLTTGIISSLNRSLPSRVQHRMMTSLIQTDAAMNPGNSGGPLLDSHARMIGMNVAIASKTGQSAGVGFAIPVNRVRRFLPDLIESGKVRRADHGIVEMAVGPNGLTVARVRPEGPADRAGLRGFRVTQQVRRQGPIRYLDTHIDRDYADAIEAVDGEKVTTVERFMELMDGHSPGEKVTITIVREGRRQEVAVTLAAA